MEKCGSFYFFGTKSWGWNPRFLLQSIVVLFRHCFGVLNPSASIVATEGVGRRVLYSTIFPRRGHSRLGA